MKTMLSGIAVFAALFTTSAIAADMPVKVPVVRAPLPVEYNWSGFYTASQIGGGWADIEGTYVLPPADRHDADLSRALYGSYIGAQYQWNQWVLGVEAGYNTFFSGDGWGTSAGPSGDCLGFGPPGGVTCQNRITNYWTAGGKLGYSFGNWMIYATGGYANGRVQTQTALNATNTVFDYTSERHGGWFAGAGFDWYVTKLWWSDLIIGFQYQHVDLDTERHFDVFTPGLNSLTRDVSATVDTFVARATFKYSLPSPAVRAAY
jgi:outer membrane immunogenic protein